MKILLILLMSLLRKRSTKDVVSFIHTALGPLFLVVFYVCMTGLSQPLFNCKLEQSPTIFLNVFEMLLFVHVLVPHCIIDCSL